MELLKFSKYKRQFIFKIFNFRLNTRPYNRLDKKIADFKKPKDNFKNAIKKIEEYYKKVGQAVERRKN